MRRPWWHWRSLTRGRLRPAIGAAVAGALLGGLGVAWQTDAGPFAPDRSCWGVLGEDDVADLFEGKRDIKTSEIPVTSDSIGASGPSGECVLTSPRGRRVTARVHELDSRFGGASDQWADAYLSARMTPLGDGLLGMVSDTRAWLAVPEGCVGKPGRGDGPLVVDMETGWTVYDQEVETGARARLARTLVKLVNGYMADRGCSATVEDPSADLPAPPRFEDEKADAVCGIKGLRMSDGREADHYDRPLVTRGRGPVRTCDRHVLFDHPRLRLMTVEDPRLSALYKRLSYTGGTRVRGAGDGEGSGFVRPDLGLFQAMCPTGEATFLVRTEDGDKKAEADIRVLLPRYVAAEADRMGCGPLRIRLPA
ncbi:hypothetical protein [Streptomyces sp. NPDC059009]|uniref:hypothetical protein n=1 Tax=Streptomyces sp. NPDC059009 TaxID=3346694 RepID=UPI0036B98386